MSEREKRLNKNEIMQIVFSIFLNGFSVCGCECSSVDAWLEGEFRASKWKKNRPSGFQLTMISNYIS